MAPAKRRSSRDGSGCHLLHSPYHLPSRRQVERADLRSPERLARPDLHAKPGQRVQRVAHHVAAYFVRINDSKLVSRMHSLGDLLQNAEAYHTQWVTNRQMTGTTARQIEQTQANVSAAEQALEALRAKRAATHAE